MNKEEYDKARNEQLPWIEKYRPQFIGDIIFNDNMQTKIYEFIKSNNIPNMILTGVPGIGKTTTIRCIGMGLYGKYYNNSVLELNASDDRGIKSVQIDIINFCRTKQIYNKEDENKYCKHKLIILDEADNMMDKAQHQINTLMEKYKDTVKFAFTCNSSSDIIEAIQSRCIILKYIKLTNSQIVVRLKQICKIEKIKSDKSCLTEIADLSHGDLRHAINNIQLMFNKYGVIKTEHIPDICNLPQPITIKQIFINCQKNDLKSAIKLLSELKNSGYSYTDITIGMLYTIKSHYCEDFSDDIKIIITEQIGNTYYNLSKYVESLLQMIALLININMRLN